MTYFLITIFMLLSVAGWWLQRGKPRHPLLLGVRVAIVALLLAALWNPVQRGSLAVNPIVFVVDQSASLPADVRSEAWNQASAAAERMRPFRPVRVIAFGADAAPATDSISPTINPDGTDIAAGLRLAEGFLPSGGDVVLVSDGGATTNDAAIVTRRWQTRGITLNAVPIEYQQTDVRLESLRVPPALREGERFSADVVFESSVAGQIRLELTGDDAPLAARTLDVQAGRNVVSFQSQAGTRGFHRFKATLVASNDEQPANNVLEAWTVVGLPPRVLVVERAPDTAANLRNALENAGLVTEAIRPSALSSSMSQLSVYDAIILQDVSANDLSLDQQLALREFVRSLGHGLVTFGGTNSYSLGGYANTPLEEVLPVSMQPPPRRERPVVTLLLIVDRSASMLGAPGRDKFSLAKAAAIGATETLGAKDTIGVLAFDSAVDWVVNFTTIGTGLQLSEIQSRIATLEAGGGTNIYDALAEGLPELARQSGTVRHAVLLTDGRSSTGSSYEALIKPLRDQGMTLSTIAIGADADTELLQSLAQLGAGRYHFAAEPEDLPRLTLQETEIARENPLSEGTYQANLNTPHPAIRGLNISDLPQYSGYIAVTTKPEAEQLLSSPEGDVLLATWQYGLGRATAFTSDAGERWTSDWRRWDGWGTLVAQIVAATYPDPAAGNLRISTSNDNQQTTIMLDATTDANEPLDLADIGIRVIAPDRSETVLRASQIAPGRYSATMPTPQQGAYHVLAALEKGTTRLEAQSGFVRRFSPEWSATQNPSLLNQLAVATGGRSGTLDQLSTPPQNAEPIKPPRSWWQWFVALAAILWLVDVAGQRGWLRRWLR